MTKRLIVEELSGRIGTEPRFAFGKNWGKFLHVVNNERIESAKASLALMLDMREVSGKRF